MSCRKGIVANDKFFADCVNLMPRPKTVVILSYPAALQSAVLGLVDFLEYAGLSAQVIRDPSDAPKDVQAIVLPPASGQPDLGANPQSVEWLARQSARGTLICSACLGVTWVAAAGLDAGRSVTTHWGAAAQMRKEWPALVLDTDRLVVEYSDLVTAGGLMAWIDLALIIIERLAGQRTMLDTARHFVVDPGRRDQRRFQRFEPPTGHGDDRVQKAQRLLETEMHKPLAISRVASHAGLTPRTLQRRFQAATGLSVTQYLQKLRVERAKTLLADSGATIGEIAAQIGYTDVPAFHRIFHRITGLTPSGFRETVRSGAGG